MKIVLLSDALLVESGFACQARQVLLGLREKGHEVVTIGEAINWQSSDPQYSPDGIKIYPCRHFGSWPLFRKVMAEEQPDVFIAFSEVRQLQTLAMLEHDIRKHCPLIHWHLWDNPPFPWFNLPFYESFDRVVCTTLFAYDLLKDHVPNVVHLPLGVDLATFKFLGLSKRQELRAKFEKIMGQPLGFTIGYVGRNLRRKRLLDVLAIFEQFQPKKQTTLFMHTDPHDPEGPNLLEARKVLVDNKASVLFTLPRGHSSKVVNELYNVFDVNLNISWAEGFGLPALEAMAAGCPSITNENAGSIELIDSSCGWLLPNAVQHLSFGGVIKLIGRSMVADEVVLEALEDAYAHPELRVQKGRAAVSVAASYSMAQVVNKWDSLLQEVVEQHRAPKRYHTVLV